jgi:hypothetical protein
MYFSRNLLFSLPFHACSTEFHSDFIEKIEFCNKNDLNTSLLIFYWDSTVYFYIFSHKFEKSKIDEVCEDGLGET